MTPLPQQLEDKKKAMIEIENAMEHFREKSPIQYDIWFHKFEIVVKEIAILEQAIAEKKKRDEEVDNAIDFLSSYPIWTKIYHKEDGDTEEIPDELYPILDNFLKMIQKVLKKQLQSHIYRGNSSKEKDNERVPISESATDEVTTDGKAHHQILLQKQRQDFIEMMNNEIKFWKSEEKPDETRKLQVAFMIEIIDSFKGQLNQPETENGKNI